MDTVLLEGCYQRSLELLRRNSTAYGILAATRSTVSIKRRYESIFGRDAAICSLGMAVSGEADLIDCARAGLVTLARYQAPNGQIPKYVKPDRDEVDFWYSGCIDATLWWLIAVYMYDRATGVKSLTQELSSQVALALQWLSCQEHQGWYLLQQNEASDWADIMPRSGFVLYSNALWCWVKRLYKLPAANESRKYANLLLNPSGNQVPDNRRVRLLLHYIRNRMKGGDFYLSFVNLASWGEDFDVFGNVLAALTGMADTGTAGRIARYLIKKGVAAPFPIRVIDKPIEQESRLWRPYMYRHRQNLPWQYHNGGIWPFAGGFFILLLARMAMERDAWQQLEGMALASRINDWEFNEWFHGITAKPMGMPGQSWNAALYVLAYHTLCSGIRLLP